MSWYKKAQVNQQKISPTYLMVANRALDLVVSKAWFKSGPKLYMGEVRWAQESFLPSLKAGLFTVISSGLPG
jgi:hypothetical protein